MKRFPNRYRMEDTICYIDCFNKQGDISGTIIIDVEDLEKVNKYLWHIDHSRENIYYAQASVRGTTIRMHRLLIPTPLQIDHINHNGLDNRKCNLRACTNRENNCNKNFKRHPLSGYTGIRFNSKVGSYYVRIMVNKKEISLGHYKTLEAAVKARKQGEIKYFGKFKYNDIC